MLFRFGTTLFFCVLFSSLSYAVDSSPKEKLKITFKSGAPEKLYLYSFYGIASTKIDSAKGDELGVFRFHDRSAIKRGFYRVAVNDTNYVDVILSPKENVELLVTENSLKKEIVVKKSLENKALWELKTNRIASNKKKRAFISQLEKNKGNTPVLTMIKKSIDSIDNATNVFTLDLLNKNKETYFYLTSKSVLSPLYTDATMLVEKYKSDTTKFLKENFFNNIDFSNEEIVHSTLIPNQLMKYFERHVEYDEPGFKYGIDLVLTKAKANPAVYQVSLDFLLKLFNEAGPEIIFEYIVNTYYDKNTCNNEYAVKADKLKSLTVGHALPEIDLSGFTVHKNLKEIYTANKYTLVYFWSSHCNFCAEAQPAMIETYKSYHKSGLEIVGFSIDESEADWKKYIAEKNMGWLNFNELKGWDSKVARSLMVNKTPTYFLIDSNGVILGKNHNFVDIKGIIDSLLRSNK